MWSGSSAACRNFGTRGGRAQDQAGDRSDSRFPGGAPASNLRGGIPTSKRVLRDGKAAYSAASARVQNPQGRCHVTSGIPMQLYSFGRPRALFFLKRQPAL